MPTLIHVMTVPVSLRFLRGQVRFISEHGFNVHVITSRGPELDEFGRCEPVTVHAVEMTRRITPFRDVIAIWQLWRLFRRIRPDIVHAHTPKGGMLGMIAARLARVPARVYHVRGLPFMTRTGFGGLLMRATERVSCLLAHRVLAVSDSMRRVAIKARICPADKIVVLLGGSGNGVDAEGVFKPRDGRVRLQTRYQYGIPRGAVVVGFVGRLVRDKGIVELSTAWKSLRTEFTNAHLLLVGPFEEQDPIPSIVREELSCDSRIHLAGFSDDTPALYSAVDVVVLPTYREGFPNVPLEAAAMELPVVASEIPGCTDAVERDVTGLLVPPRDTAALVDALRRYLRDARLRRAHGLAGRRRVLRLFRPESIWRALLADYYSLLSRTAVERSLRQGS